MSLELLACRLDRNDEVPNVELAEKLCGSMNKKGIREIVLGLKSNDQAVANDCSKVLHVIGQRKPTLIAEYADDFLAALSSKNNRIVWGSMQALACITPWAPDTIYRRLPEVLAAYEKGSVITIDHSISVFAHLCNANDDYRTRIFPILLAHLAKCRAKEIPQHAERIAICIDPENKKAFVKALESRLHELSETQKRRVTKLMKMI